MNCREFVEFLDRYVDGSLSSTELAGFEEHLGECPACVAYLDGYRKTIVCARSAEELERSFSCAPPDLINAILSARPST